MCTFCGVFCVVIIAVFYVPVVSQKEYENFDRYITDQRVHPGPLGMDKMTQALINAMMKQDDASWMVSQNLVNL